MAGLLAVTAKIHPTWSLKASHLLLKLITAICEPFSSFHPFVRCNILEKRIIWKWRPNWVEDKTKSFSFCKNLCSLLSTIYVSKFLKFLFMIQFLDELATIGFCKYQTNKRLLGSWTQADDRCIISILHILHCLKYCSYQKILWWSRAQYKSDTLLWFSVTPGRKPVFLPVSAPSWRVVQHKLSWPTRSNIWHWWFNRCCSLTPI